MRLKGRQIRAFTLAPVVIAMAFTLHHNWECALQAAIGGFWLGLAVFERFLQRK